jgi:hypothetical protein
MKVIQNNKYITLRVPKKIALVTLAFVSAGVISLSALKPANALTSEPQPSATTFMWGSVSADTGRFNRVTAVSYDGQRVMFRSSSPLYVEGDTNAGNDIFVKDLSTNVVQRISVSNSGGQLTGVSGESALSPNGQYAAFTQLVGSHEQVYVRDLTANTTTLASSDSGGVMGNNNSYPLSISNTGLVALNSSSTNLDSSVTSGANVYIKNLSTGATNVVNFIDPTSSSHVWSVNNNYGQISSDGSTILMYANDPLGTNTYNQVVAQDLVHSIAQIVSYTTSPSTQPVNFENGGLSSTGRYALFGERNASWSSTVSTLFMKDLQTGTITAVDQAPSGRTNNGSVADYGTAIANDGSEVGFMSTATTLDPGYNPSRSSGGARQSQYVTNISTGVSTMVVNQISGNSYYAPGGDKFAIDSSDSIDNADPDGIDVYIAQN